MPARGQLFLPLELLERHGADREDVRAGRATPQLRAALADLRGSARRHLRRAQELAQTVSPSVMPALLPVALAGPTLARMERRDYDPFVPIEIAPWRRQWLIWRAARRPSRIFSLERKSVAEVAASGDDAGNQRAFLLACDQRIDQVDLVHGDELQDLAAHLAATRGAADPRSPAGARAAGGRFRRRLGVSAAMNSRRLSSVRPGQPRQRRKDRSRPGDRETPRPRFRVPGGAP